MARPRFQIWLDIRAITVEELARRVDVSNQAVNRWLSHGIPATRLDDVAQALRIKPEELLPFVDDSIDTKSGDKQSGDTQSVQPIAAPQKRSFGRSLRPNVETEAANSTAQAHSLTNEQFKNHQQPNDLPKAGPFADRRNDIDRRRSPTLAPGTPSRRLTQERRDTSYSNTQGHYWWLKVDYLDGAGEEESTLQYLPAHEGFREVTVSEAARELEQQFTGTNAD